VWLLETAMDHSGMVGLYHGDVLEVLMNHQHI